ncbi:hypothetical protein [Sphingobium indicum]|uniref:hypothetical protein n=1 Tax=Sphingobium indicum TaxID=332055 RepID=UPI00056D4271|nr:hypothetical protein [Sphingobium indicum]
MTLTLAVLASMLILMPGLTFLGIWNLRVARTGAARPELPLSSATSLLLAIGISLLVHFLGWAFAELLRGLFVHVGTILPPAGHLWEPFELALRPQGELLPVFSNPIESMVRYADGSHLLMDELAGFCGLVILECAFVAAAFANDGFELLIDGIDLNGQGWAYHHYVRPSQHGYRPIGYALTTYQQNDLGIGYIGTIADIRHSDKGELVSLSLLNPDRFLFQLKPAIPERHSWGKPPEPPAFTTFGREPIGGIVVLDSKVVANFLVKTLDRAVLDDIGTVPDLPSGPIEASAAEQAAP